MVSEKMSKIWKLFFTDEWCLSDGNRLHMNFGPGELKCYHFWSWSFWLPMTLFIWETIRARINLHGKSFYSYEWSNGGLCWQGTFEHVNILMKCGYIVCLTQQCAKWTLVWWPLASKILMGQVEMSRAQVHLACRIFYRNIYKY